MSNLTWLSSLVFRYCSILAFNASINFAFPAISASFFNDSAFAARVKSSILACNSGQRGQFSLLVLSDKRLEFASDNRAVKSVAFPFHNVNSPFFSSKVVINLFTSRFIKSQSLRRDSTARLASFREASLNSWNFSFSLLYKSYHRLVSTCDSRLILSTLS